MLFRQGHRRDHAPIAACAVLVVLLLGNVTAAVEAATEPRAGGTDREQNSSPARDSDLRPDRAQDLCHARDLPPFGSQLRPDEALDPATDYNLGPDDAQDASAVPDHSFRVDGTQDPAPAPDHNLHPDGAQGLDPARDLPPSGSQLRPGVAQDSAPATDYNLRSYDTQDASAARDHNFRVDGTQDPAPAPDNSLRSDAALSRDALCSRPTGWKRFACDSRALGQRLLLQEPGDGWRALGVLATAGGLFAGRVSIRNWVLDHRSESRTRIYDAARNLGKGAVTPLLATALYVTGKLSSNSYHTESAQILAESSIFSGILAVTGQIVLASDRPEDGRRVRYFSNGGHGISGDVAIAASVVAPLDRRYMRFRPEDGLGRKIWKTVGRTGLYAALALTALQRMDADKHWAPDVFLGAATGLATGYTLCTSHEPEKTAGARARRPVILPAANGIALGWSF